jgi:hypothetical protein
VALDRRCARALAWVVALTLVASACGSSSSAPGTHPDGAAGTSGGTAGASGTSGGTSGASGGTAGASGTSGGTAGAGGGGGTAAGGQPIGSVCANTGNCSQADGAAVCCTNMCVLQAQCPTGTQFLACTSTADCGKYGGGKVCCKEGSMDPFCTKPSGCSGTTLP